MRSPVPTPRVALLTSALCWLVACDIADDGSSRCGPASDWPVMCPSSSDSFSRDAGLEMQPTPGSDTSGDRGEPSTGDSSGGASGATVGTTANPVDIDDGASTGGTGPATTGGTTGTNGAGGLSGGAPTPADAGLGETPTGEQPVDCLSCLADPDAGAESGSSCEEADACANEMALSAEEKSLDAGSMQLSSASVQWSAASGDELTVHVRGRDGFGEARLIVVGMRTEDGTVFAPGTYGPVPAVVVDCDDDSAEQGMQASLEIRALGAGFEGRLQLRGEGWNVAFDLEPPAVCAPPD